MVSGGARLAGEVARRRRQELRAQAHGRRAAGEGATTLSSVPDILDVDIMGQVLRRLGCASSRQRRRRDRRSSRSTCPEVGHRGRLRPGAPDARDASACSGRSSPAAARPRWRCPAATRSARRGLDMHVSGLQKLGATVETEHGFLIARADRLRGATIWLDFPSVGATENLLMAAVLAKGTHGHRQRGPRAGDRRPVQTAHRDGRPARRAPAPRRWRSRASRGCTLPDVHADGARPHRRRHVRGRGGDDPGRRHGARRPGRAPGDRCSTSWSPPAPRGGAGRPASG